MNEMTAALVNVFVPMPDDPSASSSVAKGDAAALVVANDHGYVMAGNILLDIKRRRSELEAKRKELVRPVDEARELIQKMFRGPILDLDECERIVKRKLMDYQTHVEEQRREEQRKLDEAARKERERVEAQVARAAEAGKHEKAEQLAERAAAIVPPIVQREAPKVPGISMREVWLFEITNEADVPLEYRPIDAGMIGKVVRALKGSTRIPGVRVYSDKSMAAGGGR